MSENTPTQQIELDLKKLEFRVNELLDVCQNLTKENKALRLEKNNLLEQTRHLHDQHEHALKERASLTEQKEVACKKVEAMLTRLKSLEQGNPWTKL